MAESNEANEVKDEDIINVARLITRCTSPELYLHGRFPSCELCDGSVIRAEFADFPYEEADINTPAPYIDQQLALKKAEILLIEGGELKIVSGSSDSTALVCVYVDKPDSVEDVVADNRGKLSEV